MIASRIADWNGPEAREVAAAFLAFAWGLDPDQRTLLRRRGISNTAIDGDPRRKFSELRWARVIFDAPFFSFAAESDVDVAFAYVVIARDELGGAYDIVAFASDGRVASYLGRASVLGRCLMLEPRGDEPIRVFKTVFDWLRGGRKGVVILDWDQAAVLLHWYSLCVGPGELEFGRQLQAQLTVAPRIFVQQKAVAL